jgi:hypothetical protein
MSGLVDEMLDGRHSLEKTLAKLVSGPASAAAAAARCRYPERTGG